MAAKRLKQSPNGACHSLYGGSQGACEEGELMFEGAEMAAAEEVALILGQ